MRVRTRVLLGVLVVVGAMLAGGAAVALWWPPQTTVVQELPPLEVPDVAEVTAGPEQVVMPDVVGLGEDVARRVLRDASVPQEATVSAVPAPGEAGLVVTQSPEPGEPVEGLVELGVSQALAMPDVVGQDVTQARQELSALGVTVRASRRLDPAAPAGTVLGQNPAPGEDTPTVVTLTVADSGEVVSLFDTRVGDYAGRCSTTREVHLSGELFSEVYTCRPGTGEPTFREYDLEERAARFTARLSVLDVPDGATHEVVFSGDGQDLETVTVTAGEVTDVELDVSTVRALRFTIGPAAEDTRPQVVFVEASLFGDPDKLAGLAQ